MALKLEINKNFKNYNSFKKNINSEVLEIARFHSKIMNKQTPLIELPELARTLGLKELLVKDESHRFGLNAFKALGASYAMSKQIKNNPRIKTFCTATDGNHGRAVAWMAKKLNKEAIIYMPKGTISARIDAIKTEGAKVVLIDKDYDVAVQMANKESTRKNWCLVQDTAWVGYEEIPLDIMKGYWTQVHETTKQINNKKIDLVILQSGVGSWAASVVYYIKNNWKEIPYFISVEPHSSNCLFESIRLGKKVSIKNKKSTKMAGLDCGSVSSLAWKTLSSSLIGCVSISDELSEKSMKAFAKPLKNDPIIESGESGASALAALIGLCEQNKHIDFKKKIGLDKKSTVLLFNTEGATDPENYKNVIGG
jgi:diaminopropionate ammonia-lyase